MYYMNTLFNKHPKIQEIWPILSQQWVFYKENVVLLNHIYILQQKLQYAVLQYEAD